MKFIDFNLAKSKINSNLLSYLIENDYQESNHEKPRLINTKTFNQIKRQSKFAKFSVVKSFEKTSASIGSLKVCF
jgi:hypothetical protein